MGIQWPASRLRLHGEETVFQGGTGDVMSWDNIVLYQTQSSFKPCIRYPQPCLEIR
jgi:hypothetical protein